MERNLFHRKHYRSIFYLKTLALIPFGGVLLNSSMVYPVLSQTPINSPIPQERDLYNTLPGEKQTESILDVTNPMELMNRLRRATAMDNATSPSDAIDEALKAFEEND